MIIIDTSVFIEYLRGHEPYLSNIDFLLQQARVIR